MHTQCFCILCVLSLVIKKKNMLLSMALYNMVRCTLSTISVHLYVFIK